MPNNPRFGKVLYKLWLTEQEEENLNEYMETLPSIAWGILKAAKLRGDFGK